MHVCAHLPLDRLEQVVVTEQLLSKSKDSPLQSLKSSAAHSELEVDQINEEHAQFPR